MALSSYLDTQQTIAAVEAGLPYAQLDALRTRLGLSRAALAHALLTSERTLQRRQKSSTRLPVDLSDRLAELIALTEQATEVLGETAGPTWLTRPHPQLGTTPIDYARTSAGRRHVRALLTAIQHGMAV